MPTFVEKALKYGEDHASRNPLDKTSAVAAYRRRISIWELWDRRAFEEILTRKRWGGLETGICSSQEESGRVQESNDPRTVPYGA